MFGWFKHLKVGHKLALISVFFMIPDTVLLCLFLFSINDYIHFARWEKHGNEYQRPLEELLEYIPQHLLLARRALAGSEQASAQLSETQIQIGRAFDALRSVDSRIGEQLQFTDDGLAKRSREHCRVANVESEWRELKEQLHGLSLDDCTDRHVHLMSDLRTMITHAGDTSNLILDPDLDSYYLMDVTLLALPQMQVRLATAIAYGEDVLRQRSVAADQRVQLSVHAAMLREAELERVVTSAQTALNEDANFYGVSASLHERVPPALDEFSAAAEAFIQLISRLSESAQPAIDSDEFVSVGNRARRASFQLWSIADEELDLLLDRRIGAYRGRRARSLLLTVLALSAAVGFVSFITRSISGPLQRQAAELREANTTLQSEVLERQRAEESLRRAEEKYRSIFENSVEGIYQVTPGGRFLVANERIARMFGYESAAELGSIAGVRLAYVDPQQRAEFQRVVEETGTVRGFESQVVRKDGTVIWIAESARAVRDSSGAVRHYEGTVEDITERKKTEAELERVYRELVHASRKAGMAEIATGVLHNVGNVLNSVNVSVNLLTDRFKNSPVGGLAKACTLIDEHRETIGEFVTYDERGRHLPDYLRQLSKRLDAERDTSLDELRSLVQHVEHIKEIVSMQQSYAVVGGVLEPVSLERLVQDAIKVNDAGLIRHGVDLDCDFQLTPPVTTDKNKILQILINLISNAKYALSDSNTKDKQLLIRVSQPDEDHVHVVVAENGVGIPAENLTRIFQHGFTTRKDGHGFGLHSSALAAQELGGSLTAHSAGPGQGATFTLELPVDAVAMAEEIKRELACVA